jgi:chromosome segregation ATPase
LDAERKDKVAELKRMSGAIDAVGKVLQDGLAELRDLARSPVTQMEEAEKREAARIESEIAKLRAEITDPTTGRAYSLDILRAQLSRVQAVETGDARVFGQHTARAAIAKDAAITQLSGAIAQAEEAERQAAEAARLREAAAAAAAEAAARAKVEAEHRAKLEAEQRARIQAQLQAERAEAEAAAKAAAAAAEAKARAEYEARAEADRLRAAAAAAEAESRRVREEAARAEAARQAAEAAKAEAERQAAAAEAARQADRAHRARVNSQAAAALVAIGLTDEQAKAVIIAIAKGGIPAVSINY